jgi:aminoglycoside phosphotransferase family enzyme/predicted kinase
VTHDTTGDATGDAADDAVDDAKAALAAWLRRRDDRHPVEFVETHISVIAIQHDRVYKLKKAVRFPFIDLSTPELRTRDCEREVELNRRFAPDVYLGVTPVTDEHGAVVDHVVEMRRMPAAQRLSRLVADGGGCGDGGDGGTGACLERLAADIASAHRQAARNDDIDAAATRDAVARRWQREFTEMRPFAGSLIDPATLFDIEALATRYLDGRRRCFDARIAAGRVCDGHGDLLADDVYCLPDGPRALDCIEFDDRLRWTDGLADVAFLAMDLERLGRADLARHFLDAYRRYAADDWPRSLEHHYVAYRALVRAKVACLRTDVAPADTRRTVQQFLHLVSAHLREGRVRLVLVGGGPGTGKTTVARELAQRQGWVMLRSDEVRKELVGVTAPTQPQPSAFGEGLYTRELTDATYGALLDRARDEMELGETVVLDATWSDPRWRDRAVAVARECASDLVALRCDAPAEITDRRIEQRLASGRDASDATPAIAARIRESFAPWPDATVVDTAGTVDAAVEQAITAVS